MIGWSDLSLANTAGELVQTKPVQMSAPTRGSGTNTNTIVVNWVALTGDNTGGASIASYNLQWDNGSDGANWYELVGITSNVTALTYTKSTGVTPGV